MPDHVAITKMMEACEQDPKLKSRLFHEPKAVAKEHGVELSEVEVQQLKRVGALMSLADEFKAGRIGGRGPFNGYPVGYAIDTWWKDTIFNHVVSYRSLFNPLFNPIFYPIGYVFNVAVAGQEFNRQFAALRLRRR